MLTNDRMFSIQKQPKNTEEQLKQTEESSMPDAVLAAPDVSGDSPDDASPVEDCSEEEVIATEPELSQLQPEDVDKWKAQIRELYLAARSTPSNSDAAIVVDFYELCLPQRPHAIGVRSRRSSESAGTALQQEPTSSTCLCRGCSDGEKPQGPLHSTKPRGRKEFEKKRIVDPDTPLPYS
ncbi:hypothetical protein V5799_027155 [Amblyomma americanum]|uniref:Uncharacterized protein n=2 Tax=Amblyomma americanum TaxID=6943 RepID=A0AAQ4DGI8_AMBAM